MFKFNKTTSVITIDGPSGAGKGTIAAILAHQLKWHVLDSGILYRLVAFAAIRIHMNLSDENKISELALNLDIRFELDSNQKVTIFLVNELVKHEQLRTEKLGEEASKIAAMAKVREALLNKQRAFVVEPGLIADGRDMGTVVFPNAQLKIFLTASIETRAKRRCNQLKNQGEFVDYSQIFQEIKKRDERDKNRVIAPLMTAEDAIEIDSTDYTAKEVADKILLFLKEKSLC